VIIIKDKNPLIRKNGAKGTYFSPFFALQMHENMQANNMLMANPIVPTQIPPAPNNFISPSPIGGYFLSFCVRSKIKPTIKPRQYPNAPPITESAVVTGHEKNVVINKPANRNGNK